MSDLAGPAIRTALTTRMEQQVSDPPTASEEAARITIVKMLWIMHEEDPDSIGPVGTEPRDTWMSMLGEPYEDQIAAAVAVMWP